MKTKKPKYQTIRRALDRNPEEKSYKLRFTKLIADIRGVIRQGYFEPATTTMANLKKVLDLAEHPPETEVVPPEVKAIRDADAERQRAEAAAALKKKVMEIASEYAEEDDGGFI